MANLRRYLVAGLLVWLPILVTVLVLKFLIDLVDNSLLLLPAAIQPEGLIGFRIPGLGILLSGAVLLATGMVVTNLFGRGMVKLWEGLLGRIPFVRAIYSASKQLAETLFSGTGKSFRKVVMVFTRMPAPGRWRLSPATAWSRRPPGPAGTWSTCSCRLPPTRPPASSSWCRARR